MEKEMLRVTTNTAPLFFTHIVLPEDVLEVYSQKPCQLIYRLFDKDGN